MKDVQLKLASYQGTRMFWSASVPHSTRKDGKLAANYNYNHYNLPFSHIMIIVMISDEDMLQHQYLAMCRTNQYQTVSLYFLRSFNTVIDIYLLSKFFLFFFFSLWFAQRYGSQTEVAFLLIVAFWLTSSEMISPATSLTFHHAFFINFRENFSDWKSFKVFFSFGLFLLIAGSHINMVLTKIQFI